ncbi:alpha/beta hydrolase [Cellulosimicrobium arenosum]|uniref:Alpha/beta hydrolase n=1 Tax=Cellulosimicrobium arenosum TaxID=2708133 RepID=A0A927G6T9_9MICO|nr:alpha/beta hydrolase [Cellulosimicrobium arenosum]MBD8077778.1 alpha/beta hydrolase [Cellulosimicrobium arenosum]
MTTPASDPTEEPTIAAEHRSPQDPARSRTVRPARTILLLVVALALLAAPAWVLATTGDVVRHQHWALGALLATSAGAGLVLVALTLRRARRRRDPCDAPERGRRVWSSIGEGACVVLLVGIAAAVVWVRPFPATDRALADLESSATVEVLETAGWVAFVPSDDAAATGLVYSPGARVDVRAAAHVLRPLAEAGYVVVALKEPLGIAVAWPGQSGTAIAGFDDVDRWAAGGHSLGGVVASSYAAGHEDVVGALLLHGSYPAGDISGADLQVTSVWGSRDGLTTPDAVEASRADLPGDATFVEVVGGVHGFFADYGPQPGDGTPTITRDDAQAQVVAASIDAMDRLAADRG